MKKTTSKQLTSIAFGVLSLLILSSCQNNDNLCDSTNTQFMALYNAAPGADINSWDIQVYQYTFKSSISGTICGIGYQGNVNLSGLSAYKMEIIRESDGAILYNGVHSFTSNARSYVNFPALSITANQTYTIRRTVVNNLGDVSNTISHFKPITSPFAPIVNGNITIESTKTYELYNNPTPYNISINTRIPCIDFVFNL